MRGQGTSLKGPSVWCGQLDARSVLEFAGLGSFAAVGTAGCVRGFGSGIKRGLAVIRLGLPIPVTLKGKGGLR